MGWRGNGLCSAVRGGGRDVAGVRGGGLVVEPLLFQGAGAGDIGLGDLQAALHDGRGVADGGELGVGLLLARVDLAAEGLGLRGEVAILEPAGAGIGFGRGVLGLVVGFDRGMGAVGIGGADETRDGALEGGAPGAQGAGRGGGVHGGEIAGRGGSAVAGIRRGSGIGTGVARCIIIRGGGVRGDIGGAGRCLTCAEKKAKKSLICRDEGYLRQLPALRHAYPGYDTSDGSQLESPLR